MTPNEVADDQVHVVPRGGNFAVVVGNTISYVVSLWGSESDATHAAHRLKVWLRGVLIADRRENG